MLLNNVVDRIWIAHIPDVGQLAFTASGVCVPIVYMIMALAELTGTGISSRVGLLLGQGHHDQAERTLGSMMAFSLLLAMLTLLFAAGGFFLEHLNREEFTQEDYIVFSEDMTNTLFYTMEEEYELYADVLTEDDIIEYLIYTDTEIDELY